MKIFDIILEEEAPKIYAIGDSHAVAIAQSGGFVKLAAIGRSAFSEENLSAIDMVPPKSTVVLSAGANDMKNQNRGSVIQRIEKLLFELVNKKKCNVWFVLLAGTDAPAFVGEKNLLRNELAKQIPADFPTIKILDMGNLSIATGDGIHAPTPWYQQAAAKIKKSVPPAEKEPTPTTQSGQEKEKEPVKIEKPSDAGAGQSSSEFSKDDPRRLDKVPSFTVPQGNGSELKKLQLALIVLGYSVGVEKDDGLMGPHTRKGIKHFQRDHKLPETGTFDEATVDAIAAAVQEAYKNGKKPSASSGGNDPGQSGMITPTPSTGDKKYPRGATPDQIARYGERITTKIDEQEMLSYVESKLSRNHAVAMVVNGRHESLLEPGRWVSSDGGQGPSGGLFMFHDATMNGKGFFSDMVESLGGPGKWQYDWKGQIDFALSYPRGRGPKFASMKFATPEEATYWFCYNFEVPDNREIVARDRAKEALRYKRA